MGSSGHEMPTAWGTGAVNVPAVSSMTPASKMKKNWLRNWLEKVTDFLNIFDPPLDVRESVWCKPACGFLLTFMYLVGVIVIIVLYTVLDDGRPPKVHIEFVSPAKIQDGSMEDYSCACDLPAEVQTYRKDDPDTQMSSRRQHLNRCYRSDEVQDIDVLQFGDDTVVGKIIDQGKSGRTPYVRTLNSSYTVRWESYELTSRNGDLFDRFDDPFPELSQELEHYGYVGEDGVVNLRSLAGQPFFTVPQGFIRADVSYNCTNCIDCEDLWVRVQAFQPAPEVNLSGWNEWISCYPTGRDLDGVCQGACRFFPTLNLPWGIAMHDISNVLLRYIPEMDDPLVSFRSRLVYAFVEEFRRTPKETYDLRFMDIQRSDVLWAEILRSYSNISSCATDNVEYRTGTSICQAAAIYAPAEINSEKTEIKCLPKESRPRKQCKAAKENLELEFRDKREAAKLKRLCDPFKCQSVQSSQITWNGNELVGGEIALSRLIFTPSVTSGYRASLCTNDYRQVFLKRNESDPKQLISIHNMTCNNRSNAKLCWMTGAYKNVTDTSWDPWREYPFTPEEMAVGEKMFACYRFDKEGYHKYMYEQFGVVSGIIGSWLLILSCIFWVIIKTNMPASLERWVPLENSETSDRPQTETSEIVTGPDETQGHNHDSENDNIASQHQPVKICIDSLTCSYGIRLYEERGTS